MTAIVTRGNAADLHLPDGTVDPNAADYEAQAAIDFGGAA